MKNERDGKCRICGGYSKLSFEHIPPKKAFNDKKAFIYEGRELMKQIGSEKFPWDTSGLRYRQMQGGIGSYTLCGDCNNKTGGWYAPSFIDFIHLGYRFILDYGYPSLQHGTIYPIKFYDLYPLKIIKQVFTMFCSINSPELAETHPDIRKFILSKQSCGLDPNKYALLIYLGKGALIRNIGISGMLSIGKGKTRVISELSTPPFGFVL
ncbi:hypothetical protein KJ596_00300, partial [Patescibacteria group bacterium]|nr:hypothetical protein [Patescibacteria group bacterium]